MAKTDFTVLDKIELAGISVTLLGCLYTLGQIINQGRKDVKWIATDRLDRSLTEDL